MKIALGSDENTNLVSTVIDELRSRGHDVEVIGPPAGEPLEWAEVGLTVAQKVTSGESEQGVLFCWTGTGVSIAANKMPGIRAALCWDAETARGARLWNDANVLCLSLRATTEAEAKEILDAWFDTSFDESERGNVQTVNEFDSNESKSKVGKKA